MTNNFEWSESGLNLLNIIQGIIQKEGGRYKMLVKVVRENQDFYKAKLEDHRKYEVGQVQKKRKNGFDINRDLFIIRHWNTHTLEYIGNILGVHLSTVSLRGAALGLPPRLKIHFKSEKAKPVIVSYKDSDVKYWSISAAAAVLHISNSYINKALRKGYRVRGLKIKLAESF